MMNGPKCTDMCTLPDCDNRSDVEESADEDSDEDEDDDGLDFDY